MDIKADVTYLVWFNDAFKNEVISRQTQDLVINWRQIKLGLRNVRNCQRNGAKRNGRYVF